MTDIRYSLSFVVGTDPAHRADVLARLDDGELSGAILDLLAQHLDGLPCDISLDYDLARAEPEPFTDESGKAQAIPMYLHASDTIIIVKVGSPQWFDVVENGKRFYYQYAGHKFTVKFETRMSRGKPYSYWRAYSRIDGRLYTKQLGDIDALTKEALDAVGAHFLRQRDNV